jgi:hypothetical protein
VRGLGVTKKNLVQKNKEVASDGNRQTFPVDTALDHPDRTNLRGSERVSEESTEENEAGRERAKPSRPA